MQLYCALIANFLDNRSLSIESSSKVGRIQKRHKSVVKKFLCVNNGADETSYTLQIVFLTSHLVSVQLSICLWLHRILPNTHYFVFALWSQTYALLLLSWEGARNKKWTEGIISTFSSSQSYLIYKLIS